MEDANLKQLQFAKDCGMFEVATAFCDNYDKELDVYATLELEDLPCVTFRYRDGTKDWKFAVSIEDLEILVGLSKIVE